MKNIKFILGDIQKNISSILQQRDSNLPNISESLLYDIVFFIESELSKKQERIEFANKNNNIKTSLLLNKNGIPILVKTLKTELKHSIELIYRHMDILIDNNILWRSKLEYNNKVNSEREPHRYNINNSIKIKSFERFIYTSYKKYQKLKLESPVIDTVTKANIYSVLMNTQIDVLNATKKLLSLDMKLDSKIKQSFNIYKIAFQKFNISQKKDDRRIFHNIVGLNKDIHPFILINGTQVSEVDAKQSQLVLLSVLTKDIDSSFYKDIHNNGTYLYTEIINFWKEKLFNDSILMNKDIYFKYYDNKITKKISYTKITKKIIKPILYAALFSGFNNKSYNAVTAFFEYKYPVLVEYIRREYNKENSLALKLQKMEASIWISAFNKLYKKDIICLTKHDAILFKYYNKDIVIKELIYQYKLKLNINITRFNIDTYFNMDICKNTKIEFFDKPKLMILEEFKKTQKNTDLTEYTFTHKDGRTWCGIKSKFSKEFNLDKKNVNKFLKNKSKSINGWVSWGVPLFK